MTNAGSPGILIGQPPDDADGSRSLGLSCEFLAAADALVEAQRSAGYQQLAGPIVANYRCALELGLRAVVLGAASRLREQGRAGADVNAGILQARLAEISSRPARRGLGGTDDRRWDHSPVGALAGLAESYVRMLGLGEARPSDTAFDVLRSLAALDLADRPSQLAVEDGPGGRRLTARETGEAREEFEPVAQLLHDAVCFVVRDAAEAVGVARSCAAVV